MATSVTIRGLRDADLEDVHEILTSPHVIAGSMRVPHYPAHETRERLAPKRGTYHLVAEVDRAVAGFAEFVTYPDEPRHRHVGEISMVATHADFLRQGVGRALVEEMIEMADNWLNLVRLWLIVFDANTHAVRTYEQLGFAIEGTMPRFGFGDGEWMDAHLMGRLRDA